MRNKGFTLIELVVAMGILALIIGVTVTVLNPARQMSKANLSKKQSDLEQIKAALDLYYDDKKCYPPSGSIQFGGTWTSGEVTYMVKVPQTDNQNEPYTYETFGTCPQWYVLYAKISGVNTTVTSISCPISQTGCRPPDDTDNHICVYGGIVDCQHISSTALGD